MYLNTNVSSLMSRGYLNKSNNSLSSIMERLSSGKRINGAKDDAAGLGIATRMTSQIRGLDVAERNARDGISMLSTAESAMGSVSDILQRMRELAVQADNGTYDTSDLSSLKQEFDSLVEEIDHISTSTKFNNKGLLDGTVSTVNLHISDSATDTLDIDLAKIDSTSLSISGLDISTGAQAAISAIDGALDTVSEERGNLGASINRLDFVLDNINSSRTNISASRSRIEDTDYAHEMSELTKQQILQQTTTAMLSRSNQNSQLVLQLLQG